jgi:hypothetical protein
MTAVAGVIATWRFRPTASQRVKNPTGTGERQLINPSIAHQSLWVDSSFVAAILGLHHIGTTWLSLVPRRWTSPSRRVGTQICLTRVW